MFAYCENNPVDGYDPTGEWDRDGFLLGATIAIIGIAVVSVCVCTAGTASPLVAALTMSLGAGLGVATAETGASLAAAAATDSAAVFDFSLTSADTGSKQGYSLVVDYGSHTIETYSHIGASTSAGSSVTYGAGVVYNYKGPGTYAGDFVDVSTSANYRGMDYGIEMCFDPELKGAAAFQGTVGISSSFSPRKIKIDIVLAYDHYTSQAVLRW